MGEDDTTRNMSIHDNLNLSQNAKKPSQNSIYDGFGHHHGLSVMN
jgi:hypothetical protein